MSDSRSGGLPSAASIIETSPMRFQQWLIIGMCLVLLALDGYDVISISLAGAGIKEEWGLSQAGLGFLLPLEFIGMAIGSIFIGSMSDNLGRRLTLIVCLLILTLGMGLSGIAESIEVLAISRVFTGIGIGGVLAGATALVSEYSNAKNRSVCVILIAAAYTVGVWAASKLAGPILIDYDWRVIFMVGAGISLVLIPLFWIIVPESIAFLERKQGKLAQAKIARTLDRIGHASEFVVQKQGKEVSSTSFAELFKGDTARITTVMMICYFGNIMTYYFFVKWVPPALVDIGYSKSEGTEVLAMISLGGLIGSVAMALLLRFLDLKLLMVLALLGSAVSVACFSMSTDSVDMMQFVGALAGFFIFAAIGGFLALFAQSFAPAVLASGTGVVLGFGRGGAVLGPWAGGILFNAGFALGIVAPIMSLGSAISGLSLILLGKTSGSSEDSKVSRLLKSRERRF